MTKKRIYILGIITMLVFPIPALWALWYFKDLSPWQVIDFGSVFKWQTLLGLAWGVVFAFISIKFLHNKWFDEELKKQEEMISSMHLNLFDKIFLSLCAGFGEEILFRSGMQTWAGIWITSIVFIAIHGYLNPKKPRLSLYGLLLMPFILSLGYALEPLGIWFCIAAHFSYDLVLFLYVDEDEKEEELEIVQHESYYHRIDSYIEQEFEGESCLIERNE